MAYENKKSWLTNRQGISLVLAAVLLVPALAWANPKVETLKQKIADINLLHQQLSDRSRQVQSARDALMTQKQELTNEIAVLMKSDDISSYRQAENNLRIHYNLSLLGILEAYMQTLETKLRLYQTGCDKLSYLSVLADDDIKMITTLNDLEIDALTTQISLVINRYLPEAHVIQIDPVRIEPVPPEQVWKRLFK